MPQHLTNLPPSETLRAIVDLAAKHAGSNVTYRDSPVQIHELDWAERADAHDTGYCDTSGDASLWYDGPPAADLGTFWREFDRLTALQSPPLSNPICLGNISKSTVACELVLLTAKHIGISVDYHEQAHTADLDPAGRGLVDVAAYAKDRCSIWVESDLQEELQAAFWEEFDRLSRLVRKPLDEPVLADDYPMYPGYFYVLNGKVIEMRALGSMTVERFKTLNSDPQNPTVVVQRCDITGRQARAPRPDIPETTSTPGWTFRGASTGQRKRKSRSSNKIKKVSV